MQPGGVGYRTADHLIRGQFVVPSSATMVAICSVGEHVKFGREGYE